MSILGSGRQVWNRQRKDAVLIDVRDVALGHTTKMQWNEASEWIYSDEITHPPVITSATFSQIQDILAARGRGPCEHKPHRASRTYAFAGTLFCGVCQRRMQEHWINQAPYYRCRFPAEHALANKVDHPRNVYLREDAFGTEVHSWLASLFAPGQLQHTIDLITAAQDNAADDSTAAAARARIADASQKMARYRSRNAQRRRTRPTRRRLRQTRTSAHIQPRCADNSRYREPATREYRQLVRVRGGT